VVDGQQTPIGWPQRFAAALRERKYDIGARVALTGAALLPYWQFLTLRVLYVTDDYFASDISTESFRVVF
jgi:hypothetical protein